MDSIRILMMTGDSQYGVTEHVAGDLKAGFERNGCVVDEVDWSTVKNDKDMEVKFKSRIYDFVIDFNAWAVGFWEKFIKDSATVYWAFMLDSPLWHLQRLHSCNRNVIVSFVDRNHLVYAEKELQNLSYITFMPHGGSRSEEIIPYDKRKRQVVFFGSYTVTSDYEKKLNSEKASLQYPLRKVIDRLYKGEAELAELLEEELGFEGQKLTEYQRKRLLNHFLYIDALVRNVKRVHLLEILGAHGISVEVYGNGWDDYVNKYPEYIHIRGPVAYDKSLEIIGEAKIVVNNMPLFPDGSHDRVFTAMRCGAVAVSEESIYLREELEEDQEAVFFGYKDLEALPEKIKYILSHETEAEHMAESGRVKAEKFHTWENRADVMLQILLEIKEQQKTWERTAVPVYSECDEAFNRLMFQVDGADEDMLYEKMKANALGKAIFVVPDQGLFEKLEVCRQRAVLLKSRMKEFVRLYGRMGDETSRKILLVFLQYWLYGTLPDEMPGQPWNQYFDLDLIDFRKEEVFVDCGAHQGETLIDFMLTCKCCKRAYCYEPDETNLARLKENVSGYSNVVVRSCAVGNEDKETVPMVTLDSDIEEEITFIKVDIGGAEKQMLRGSEKHIRKEKPKLAIAVYHGDSDILDIPLCIEEMNPHYKFYLRYYGGNLYPNEIVLYAIYQKP